jgi:hypothetical protein
LFVSRVILAGQPVDRISVANRVYHYLSQYATDPRIAGGKKGTREKEKKSARRFSKDNVQRHFHGSWIENKDKIYIFSNRVLQIEKIKSNTMLIFLEPLLLNVIDILWEK